LAARRVLPSRRLTHQAIQYRRSCPIDFGIRTGTSDDAAVPPIFSILGLAASVDDSSVIARHAFRVFDGIPYQRIVRYAKRPDWPVTAYNGSSTVLRLDTNSGGGVVNILAGLHSYASGRSSDYTRPPDGLVRAQSEPPPHSLSARSSSGSQPCELPRLERLSETQSGHHGRLIVRYRSCHARFGRPVQAYLRDQRQRRKPFWIEGRSVPVGPSPREPIRIRSASRTSIGPHAYGPQSPAHHPVPFCDALSGKTLI
jgi:hypothetical protein